MSSNYNYMASADYQKQGTEGDQRFALIEATLAIAHEQRTANLIAFLNDAEGDQYATLHAQIVERLGLARRHVTADACKSADCSELCPSCTGPDSTKWCPDCLSYAAEEAEL